MGSQRKEAEPRVKRVVQMVHSIDPHSKPVSNPLPPPLTFNFPQNDPRVGSQAQIGGDKNQRSHFQASGTNDLPAPPARGAEDRSVKADSSRPSDAGFPSVSNPEDR